MTLFKQLWKKPLSKTSEMRTGWAERTTYEQHNFHLGEFYIWKHIYYKSVAQCIGHILYRLLCSMTIKHIHLNVQKNHFLKWLECAQIPPPFRKLIVRTKDQSARMKQRFPPSLKCVWITIFISLSLAPPAVAHCVLFWMQSAFNGRPYSQPPFRAIRGLFTLIVQ